MLTVNHLLVAALMFMTFIAPPPDGAASSNDDADEVRTLPRSRGGQEVIGMKMPDLDFDTWITSDEAPQPNDGQLTLYRWWTDTCPYCEASLPALDGLREKYEDDGLAIVAVYHPKPPRDVDADAIHDAAVERKFHGPVAIDRDWSALRSAYLDRGRQRKPATSVSILVDSKGIIRFVHPGPVLFPSDDPQHERENADYELLEQAVQTLLKEAEKDDA